MNLENYSLFLVLRLSFASGTPVIPKESLNTYKNFFEEFEAIRHLSFVRSFMNCSDNIYRLEFFSFDLLRAYQLVRHVNSKSIDIFVWKFEP